MNKCFRLLACLAFCFPLSTGIAQDRALAISPGITGGIHAMEGFVAVGGGFIQVRPSVLNGVFQARIGYEFNYATKAYELEIGWGDDFITTLQEKSNVFYGDLRLCTHTDNDNLRFVSLGYYMGKARMSEYLVEIPSEEIEDLELESVYHGIKFSVGYEYLVNESIYVGMEVGLNHPIKREPASDVSNTDPMFHYYDSVALRSQLCLGVSVRFLLKVDTDNKNTPKLSD